MSRFFYYPLQTNLTSKPFTYTRGDGSPHGPGKLDISSKNEEIRALCDGKIVEVNSYSDGTWNVCQECSDNPFGRTFYIRYLHGHWNVQTGDYLKAGDLIGTTWNNDNPNYGYHLHIDFSWVSNNFDPVVGTLNFNPMTTDILPNNATYTCLKTGKVLPISGIDVTWLQTWRNQDQDWNNNKWGYCWLVFAQIPKLLSPSSTALIQHDNILSEYYTMNLYDTYGSKLLGNYSLDQEKKRLASLCYHEIGVREDVSFNSKDNLSGILLYAKLVRSCTLYDLFKKGVNSNSILENTFATHGFENAGYQTNKYINVPSSPNDENSLNLIWNLYNTGTANGLNEHCIEIASYAPYQNYGYSGYGYTNNANNEAIIKTKIENGELPGHNRNPIGVVGNTAYFSPLQK